MDIEELRTFVEVADAGGITAAAARMGLAKSIVSRRLIKLESELGAQLLARTKRGTVLTEAGATFRDYAARACAEVEVARETILPAGELRGRLRIAAPLSFGPTHFAPIIAKMAQQHPQLNIQTFYGDRFVDLVSEGFDCAIRVGQPGNPNLVARCIGPVNGSLVASPAYLEAHGAPRTLDELLDHEALMQANEAWQLMNGEEVVTVRPQGRFKADNGTALVAAAVAGLGIGYLPLGLTRAHLASGELVTVLPQHPTRPAGVYVVRAPAQYPARKIRVLTEMLIAYLERCPDFAPEELTP